jgi:hypothetical protein
MPLNQYERRFRTALDIVERGYLDPIAELVAASQATIEEANRRAENVEQTLNASRPVWAEGENYPWMLALGDLWALLGVQNQTAAITRIRELQAKGNSNDHD